MWYLLMVFAAVGVSSTATRASSALTREEVVHALTEAESWEGSFRQSYLSDLALETIVVLSYLENPKITYLMSYRLIT